MEWESESLPDWNLLPASNLQQIFQTLEICDVENCLSVCKNWYDEANFYLKDKVILCIRKSMNIEHVKACKRRFQLLKIKQRDDFNMLEILEALRQRKLTKTDPILETFIKYEDFPTLSKMLHLVGKDSKKLTLSNALPNRRALYNEELKLKPEFAYLGYGLLSSVEALSIEGFDNSTLLNIYHCFGNLRSLAIFMYASRFPHISDKLLKDFIHMNPYLTTLDLRSSDFILGTKKVFFDVKSVLKFVNIKNLKTLHLNAIYYEQDIKDISKHLKHLDVITIRYVTDDVLNPKNLRELLNISNLTMKNLEILSLNLNESYYDEEHWKVTWENEKNLQITEIFIHDSFILEEEVLILFTKCFPNVKSFGNMSLSSPSFTLFVEMSRNWPHLKSLTVGFLESSLLESIGDDVCDFKSLQYLNFENVDNNKTMCMFFTHLKAKKLRTLEIDFTNSTEFEELTGEYFKTISDAFPNVRSLVLRAPEQIHNVKTSILGKFPKLNSLYVTDDHPSEEAVTDFFESILKTRNGEMTIRVGSMKYLGSFDNFCKDNGALTVFKNGKLRKIVIRNKKIFFCSFWGGTF